MTIPLAVPDVNVLLALISPDHVHYQAAHAWFSDTTQWATTPYTEAGLVRLVLNPVVVGATFTAATALEVLRGLRALPLHRFLADDSSLAASHIVVAALVGHRQVTDYHLVNLVARKGAQLATFDSRLVASLAPEDRRHVTIIPA